MPKCHIAFRVGCARRMKENNALSLQRQREDEPSQTDSKKMEVLAGRLPYKAAWSCARVNTRMHTVLMQTQTCIIKKITRRKNDQEIQDQEVSFTINEV